MTSISRNLKSLLLEHFEENRQMAFVAGPRQVGKTTVCQEVGDYYLSWDNTEHQDLILSGPKAVAEFSGLHKPQSKKPVLVLDELHKFSRWKNFLKGFFDVYEKQVGIVVTGSSKLDVYRRGGDSLMGRYFLYHLHPISVGELTQNSSSDALIQAPIHLAEEQWDNLQIHGGFPEPFVKANQRFSRRWQDLRHNQLFKEDTRELTRIQELQQLEALGRILAKSSSEQIVYSRLSKQIRVDEKTVRSWMDTLSDLHYGFLVRPWFRNLNRALRKEPKWYLRDWSSIQDEGQRYETLIACHLYKAVEVWTDLGLGNFSLHYIRDKEQREVDFLIVRDEQPWFLVEAKRSDDHLSPTLSHFQKQLDCPHAFQVTLNAPYLDADCFDYQNPFVVPAKTLLSQLP